MSDSAADRIYVQCEKDWSLLLDRGLTTVVDPVVFRTGDVFLRGRKRIAETAPDKNAEELWNALETNIGSLAAFFDMLVLRPQLPIFDYEHTFPVWDGENWQGRAELIDMCNQGNEPVLVPITVQGDAYETVRKAAIDELARMGPLSGDVDATQERKRAHDLPDPQSELGRAIVQELSAFDYEWRPEVPGLEAQMPDSPMRVLGTFMYGGLLFGGYAQQLGGDHVLQPGRAKLFLEMTLHQSRSLNEDLIFERAFPVAQESPFGLERVVELPRTPTVLPFLLTFGDRTPSQLLERALALRSDSAVKQLREYLKTIGSQLNKGFLSPGTEAELKELGTAARRSLRPKGDIDIDLELRIDAAVVPGAGIGAKVNPARLWGWTLSQLPSRRYRKLLMRMAIARRSYFDISQHVKRIWGA
jgi:hypothetical protein